MGLEVGGYQDRPDWPRLGPTLVIATCVILAIRTAKWPSYTDRMASTPELDREIDFASHMAGRVLSFLVHRNESMFPQRKEPWYQVNEEDVLE